MIVTIGARETRFSSASDSACASSMRCSASCARRISSSMLASSAIVSASSVSMTELIDVFLGAAAFLVASLVVDDRRGRDARLGLDDALNVGLVLGGADLAHLVVSQARLGGDDVFLGLLRRGAAEELVAQAGSGHRAGDAGGAA